MEDEKELDASPEDESENESSDENDEEELRMEEQADEELLANLEKAVSDNVDNYDGHVALIGALRNSGELDRLREARKRFAAKFPLSPSLWLQWINDERRIDTPWDEIRDLFEKAVQDYLSVEVWLEYVQACCGNLTPAELREVCERALSQVGLHVADGRLLWDAYRLWESALASASTEESGQPSEASMERLFQLYKRQLSIPLIGLEETKEEFITVFGEEKFDATLKQAYNTAVEELQSLRSLEEELQASGNALDTYRQYLDYEEGHGHGSVNSSEGNEKQKAKEKKSPNVARLRCLYERAITDHCLQADLWLRYVSWLDKQFKSSASIVDVVLPVYERAVRNYTWSSTLWTKYALAYERSAVEDWPQKTEMVLDRSLKYGVYMGASNAAELWLTRAYQKRRAAEAGQGDLDDVTKAFEEGSNFLKEKFGDRDWDPSSFYRRSWASYLASKMKKESGYAATGLKNEDTDLSKSRELWKDILGSDGNGRLASVWLDYFNQVERRFGDVQEARKTLHFALSSVTDFPDYVAGTLRQFELEEGTLLDLDEAEERIRRQSARMEERKKQQHALSASSKQKQRNVGQKQRQEFGQKEWKQYDGQKERKAMKLEGKAWESKSAPKRKNFAADGQSIDADGQPPLKQVKFSETATKSIQQQPVSHPSLTDSSSISSMVSSSINSTAGESSSEGIKTDRSTKQVSEADRSKRTVFVSNLSFSLTEDRLKEVFERENIGEVVNVSLKTHVYGRSKGYGSVEFVSPESVPKALAIDRYPVEGRPMYVSRFSERKGDESDNSVFGKEVKNTAAEKYHFGAGMEKHKLFVRNIPKHATEDDLRMIFEPYGELKSVRLVTFPSGQSRGLAYIEYTDEETAAKALSGTDGTFLFQKPLSVAISNPPPRRTGGSGSRFNSQAARKQQIGDQKNETMPPPLAKGVLLPRVMATSRKPKLDL